MKSFLTFVALLVSLFSLALYGSFVGVCIWAIYRVVIHFTGV